MHTYNQPLYDQQSNEHIPHTRNNSYRQGPLQINPNSSSLPQPEFKIPDVEYLNLYDPSVNFKTQTLKLIQANAILTQIIKDTLLQKYSLTQKIIDVSDKIRRLENPHSSNLQNQSNQNLQQVLNQSLNISSSAGQIQK